MKIVILICGEGLGHKSRCLALGKEFLTAGHEVHFGAYGYSKEMVEKTGYEANEIPSEIKLVGKAGTLDFTGSIEATFKNADILGGPKLLKLIKDRDPDVVISDSYYLGALSAFTLRIPVYLIINQSNMEDFFKNRGVPLRILGKITKGFYNQIFEKVDKIIIPDYPLPYGLQEKPEFYPETRRKAVLQWSPCKREI